MAETERTERVKSFFDELINTILRDEIEEYVRWYVSRMFDGFKTFADYEKHGDMFERPQRRVVEYTPYSRQLTDGRSQRSDR